MFKENFKFSLSVIIIFIHFIGENIKNIKTYIMFIKMVIQFIINKLL